MSKNIFRMAAAVTALATTAALGACSPADTSDTSTTVQTVPGDESGKTENSADVAREMHNQMNRDSEMHDAMKDGTMPDDQMGPMGPGMQWNGMGKAPAADAPKDKADPMPPMSDM
ncbi:MAG: hypothetical protein KYX66_21890 [Blastomonas fulva]|uniref:hypothetical protein n=1 Tax=Blastomonas fulva TaxID=1550728 RepID=UPI0024E1A189|nr:hypothetical protein [Blastomonas fulva]MDK2759380.1 hypothetical protein [Blastomonas fulva]